MNNMKLLNLMKECTKNNFKCYVVKEINSYGFIITPNDNVMFISYSPVLGYKLSLEYLPSRKTGTSCSTRSEICSLSVDDILQIEKECLAYAKQLGANFYKNSESWYETYWNKKNLIEVK